MASKIRNNAIELNKIQYIDGNNRINFTTDVYSNGSPIADATAGSYANSAFAQANAAFSSANNVAPQIAPAFTQANAAFTHANAAFISANNVAPQIQPAFDTANSAALYANGAFIQSNTKLSSSGGTVNGDLAITGNLIVSGSRIEINTATVLLSDNIVTINSDLPTNIAPTENAGIEINRGSSPNVALLWNETSDSWTFTNDGTNYEQLGGGSAGLYANSAFIKANAAYAFANTTTAWGTRQAFVATAGQTVFSPGSGYLAGYIDVYYNGLKLYGGEDYTATDGINVTLASASIANDIIEIVGFGANVPVANVYVLNSMASLLNRETFFATNGQTTFTPTLSYRVGYVDVYYNGLKMNIPEDVTANNGSTVNFIGLTPITNDVIEIVGLTPNVALANAIPITGGTISGGLSLAGNVIPTSDNTYYLGSATNRWHSIFVGPGSVDIGGLKLSNVAGTLSVSSPGAPAVPIAGEDNWVRAQANASFLQANASFNTANNVGPQIAPAFNAANSASLYANGAFTQSNAAFAKANSGAQHDANTTSTGFFSLPAGNTAQRPASPLAGAIRFNTANAALELYYNGWNTVYYAGSILAEGGTIVTSGNYKIHIFTGSGSFTVSAVPAAGAYVDWLVVAGGGGGGGRHGGGGGGGGVVYVSQSTILTTGTYTVTVGAGGIGGQGDGQIGANGGNSSFGVYGTGVGGGGGGTYVGNDTRIAGQPGGSGGGAGHGPTSGGSKTQGTSPYGTTYGNAGGSTPTNTQESGGGGGAGGAGQDGQGNSSGGYGGPGISLPIYNDYYWAGGGGGSAWETGAGSGGIGGGGGGGAGNVSPASYPGGSSALNTGGSGVGGSSGAVSGGAGGTNTGGGGGGSGQNSGNMNGVGGNGGSGIVIIRYRYQ
jgi:hypothetical protein